MGSFPVQYDVGQDTIRLQGKGGAAVMLGFLLKAKFGEALDPEMLFHPDLAAILIALRDHCGADAGAVGADGPLDRAALHRISDLIVSESWRSGWWAKSRDEQVEFIQSVVVAPHRLSDAQIEFVLEGVESDLHWKRQIVEAADAMKAS